MLRASFFVVVARCGAFVFSLGACGASVAVAQLPTAALTNVYPPGGKVGATVEVTVAGADLDDAAKLVFSHAGLTAAPKMQPADEVNKTARPQPNVFTVNIAGNVPLGVHECRVEGRYGLSNPRAFHVGNFEEVACDGKNTSLAKAQDLPLAVTATGKLSDETAHYFKLKLKGGERVLCDCLAQRIDSRLDGTLTLFDAKGREVARTRDSEGRDPVLDFTAPAEGEYVLALADFLYGGSPDHFYRLTVGTAPRIDAIFPPAGVAGANGEFTVYGRNLPGGAPAAGFTVDGRGVDQVTVNFALPSDDNAQRMQVAGVMQPGSSPLDAMSYQLPSPQGLSNPLSVYFATAPVTLEAEPNDTAAQSQKVSPPCEYVGRFGAGQDRDWVQFEAQKGEAYTLEVISSRMGVYADPALSIVKVAKNEKGEETTSEVSQADDPADRAKDKGAGLDYSSDDPLLKFKADATATYRVLVRNQFADGVNDPRRAYRLAIRKEAGDFRLAASPYMVTAGDNKVTAAPLVLRQGGATLVSVTVFRRDGFEGEVSITAEGLPAGVTCGGALVGGDVSTAPLVFSVADGAAAGSALMRIVGRSLVDGKEVAREARLATVVWTPKEGSQAPMESRLSRDMSLSVVDKEKSPASVEVGDGNVVESAPGGKVEWPVKVARREFNEALKLTAMGLPETLKPGELNVAAGAGDGKLELALTNAQLKPGTYTFCLKGDAKIKYSRNPDAVKSMEADKTMMDASAKELAEKSKAAGEAKKTAAAAATAATAKVTQTQQAKTAAETDAKAKAERATKKQQETAAAKDAAGKDAANAALKDAAAAAEKALAEADAQSKQAAEALVAADKALVEAQAAAKTAEEAKAAADKASEEIDAKAKMADERAKALDTQLKDLKKKSEPKDTTVAIFSTPVKVRIHASPVKLTAPAPGGAVKQGDKAELSFTLERKFGFAEGAEVSLEPPSGVPGISAKKVDLPKDQTAGKLELALGADAPPGEHVVTLRARVKWNNVASDATQTVTLKVDPK